jgi:hypothetical protein
MQIRIWNVVTGGFRAYTEGSFRLGASVAFSPGGKRIMSRSNDITVIWNAAIGLLIDADTIRPLSSLDMSLDSILQAD